jgi:hypothetical protein
VFYDIACTGMLKVEQFFFVDWSSLRWEMEAGAETLSLTWGLHGPTLQDGNTPIGMGLWASHCKGNPNSLSEQLSLKI